MKGKNGIGRKRNDICPPIFRLLFELVVTPAKTVPGIPDFFPFPSNCIIPFFLFLFLLFCTNFFVSLHIAFLFRVSGGRWRSIVLSVLYVFIYLRFSRIHVEPFHLGPCLLTSTHLHFNLGALRKWRTERGYSTPPSAMVQSQTSATHSLSYRPVCERIVVFNKRDLVSEWGIEVRIMHAPHFVLLFLRPIVLRLHSHRRSFYSSFNLPFSSIYLTFEIIAVAVSQGDGKQVP